MPSQALSSLIDRDLKTDDLSGSLLETGGICLQERLGLAHRAFDPCV